ncbi:hypothetical protein [Mucilaginibacter myungsuensis]|uniref:Uncharacterized protein n=1 Tax=Mucilaginibacter myungsuensis TaxID=649104 RepID=A0A929KVJ4_9SPHI|nr:hypothetical protein [Mucilaginibacter myungsuensis]MBE9661240.1 hypothetical protein [Mucilaginibacter myungsuensis]MDN3597383.1 hypothetical protein [Mucilaginibacter myungsuensis]
MEHSSCTQEAAEAANQYFEEEMFGVLRDWMDRHEDRTLFRFDHSADEYLANDALRDLFLTSPHPLRKLLKNPSIESHLERDVTQVYFDEVTGDPLLAPSEQRIYNLARRIDSEDMHIPFRSVQPNKQTEAGDTSDIITYPPGCDVLRYNSGNHFVSRPANINVFDENSQRCLRKGEGNLHVIFKRGYLEDRLHEVKELTANMHRDGVKQPQYFVIYSRHSAQEGHFGVSLVIMDPANADFPQRVMICDTLLKDLPHHPRWWSFFISEYSNVFGDAVAELIEDLSHPLQKVNIHGDEPYRHDWDCPYYAASMADALAELVKSRPELILNGNVSEIHNAMKGAMPDYYQNGEIKDRAMIKLINRAKRWESGRQMIKALVVENRSRSKDLL